MEEVYVLAVMRTPIVGKNGRFRTVQPESLGVAVLRALQKPCASVAAVISLAYAKLASGRAMHELRAAWKVRPCSLCGTRADGKYIGHPCCYTTYLKAGRCS